MTRPARLPRRPPPGSSVRRALAFLAKVAATLAAKNAAYGDSVTRPLRVFSRVARGARGLADDEDTLLDLVGYLALLAAAPRARRRRPGGSRR